MLCSSCFLYLLDLLPFYGVAPLFGLNPQVPIPVDVQPIPDMGMTMVTLEPSRDVQKYSMCTVMGGIWRGVLLLDDDHPVFWYDDDDSDRTRKLLAKFLEEGSIEERFPDWLTRTSGYVKEYQRRRGKGIRWQTLTDYMKHGTCSPDRGTLYNEIMNC